MGEIARVVGHTVVAGGVLGLYLLIPLLLALRPLVPDLGTRVVIATLVLVAAEIPVVSVLIRTTAKARRR